MQQRVEREAPHRQERLVQREHAAAGNDHNITVRACWGVAHRRRLMGPEGSAGRRGLCQERQTWIPHPRRYVKTATWETQQRTVHSSAIFGSSSIWPKRRSPAHARTGTDKTRQTPRRALVRRRTRTAAGGDLPQRRSLELALWKAVLWPSVQDTAPARPAAEQPGAPPRHPHRRQHPQRLRYRCHYPLPD